MQPCSHRRIFKVGPAETFQVQEHKIQTPPDCWSLCLAQQDFPWHLRSCLKACSQLAMLPPRAAWLIPIAHLQPEELHKPCVNPSLTAYLKVTVFGAQAKPPSSSALFGNLIPAFTPCSVVPYGFSQNAVGLRRGGSGGLGLPGAALGTCSFAAACVLWDSEEKEEGWAAALWSSHRIWVWFPSISSQWALLKIRGKGIVVIETSCCRAGCVLRKNSSMKIGLLSNKATNKYLVHLLGC